MSQFRSVFPQTESLLMDRDTFMRHRDFWVYEDSPRGDDLANLTDDEFSLYDDLRNNRLGNSLRLEQEYIRYGIVVNTLRNPR